MIKNRVRMSLAVCLVFLATISFATAQYSGGSGTADDPYQIATAADLIALGETPDDYDKHFILTADIDLDPNLPGRKAFDRAVIAPDVNDAQWWFQGTPFAGVFDGNGHAISNLTIRGKSYLGLFGRLGRWDSPAMVSGLGLEAIDVNGTGAGVGGIAGSQSGSISNCYCAGTVTGDETVGGIAGFQSGSITNCYCTGTVTGDETVGGIAGSQSGSITNCYRTGIVAGTERVGGLIGSNAGRIVMSHSTAAVEGVVDVGGLVGESTFIRASWEEDVISFGSIYASYSTGTVSGDSRVGGLTGSSSHYSDIVESHSSSKVAGYADVGGLAGYNWGYITMCYSTGTISGNVNVGGLTGNTRGAITNCYSIASVGGLANVAGGLVGLNHGYLGDCYARNQVSGNKRVGGLVGMNHREVTRCYSAGSVAGDLAVGGLVGSNVFSNISEIAGCLWDAQDSGLSTMCGLGIGDDAGGRTTAEMQTASTFLEAGWDFVGETENGPNDVWKIVEGQTYPLLSWQKYGGGTGEPNDPYLIYTAEHLNALGAKPNDYDKHFKLMADIDLSGHSYDRAVIAPDVGGDGYTFPATAFTGVFDGNGYAVLNLTISGRSYLGLFGQVGPGGQVHGLGVVDVNIAGSYYAIGGLVGDNDRGRITRSYSTGTVTGYNFVGGLVGYNNYGDIALSYSHCLASGASSGNQGIGGLVGVTAGSIARSYSTGDVSGQRKVGGLVGRNYQSNITNCYSTGPVSGDSDIGGLVGASNDGTTTASFWDMDASGQSTSAGGTGRTTAEMQTGSTFLEVGWDFVHDTENGAEDIWKIAEGLDCPRLWWEEYDGQVTVELGQQFTVRLESNPSTGYRWEWVDRQASILEQIGEAQFEPRETGDPPLAGAGGWELFTFEAAGSGQMTLELVYRRPWEEGVEPLKTFSLQVVVP